MRSSVVGAIFLGVVAACGAVATNARADEPHAADLAKAREQFRRGVSLEAADDYGGALAVFKEVALVKSSPQVRFHIAYCEEKLGDLVQALGSYKLAQIEAEAAGAKDVASASIEAVTALEPRVPRLTLRRGPGAGGATVLLDGREMTGQSADALPINPGKHSVRATADGRRPFEAEVTLEAGDSKEIEIALDPEAPAPVAPSVTSAPVVPASAPGFPFTTTGFVIGGLGVASLGAAGVLFGLREGAKSELDASCGPDRRSCPESLRGTKDDGVLYSTLSTATLVVGVSAVAIGGGLVLFGPKSKPAPSVAVTPGGLIVTGRF